MPPCGTDPNDSLAGRVTAGAVPVPVRGTLCVLGVALSLKLREALLAPTANGVNVSLTVQVPPEVSGFAGKHVLETNAKSPGFVPLIVGGLLNMSDPAPVFVIVSDSFGLVVPWSTGPKAILPGVLMTPGEVPVPVRETVCELGVALSTNLRVAVSAVEVDGVKETETPQVPPAATGLAVVQVEVTMAKSAALVPLIEGLLVKESEPLPVFVSVTVKGELVV